MVEQFEVFFSNRLEVLYHNLKQSLFGKNTFPFMRRLVVVYGPAMKNWLMARFAQDKDLTIATGLEFIYLNQAFEHLLNLFRVNSSNHLPAQLEIALAIEKEIYQVIENFNLLNEAQKNIWQPLIHYLKIKWDSSGQLFISRKIERRIVGLSLVLARYFKDYGRYGGELVSSWEKKEILAWQQQLWLRLFQNQMQWTYPYREFQTSLLSLPFCEIHLFSISFLTEAEFNFLDRLSQTVSIHYYLLSPCAVFWSDIRSDKETAYLKTYWSQKLGVSSQVTQLEELLQDRNGLLANFGRLGREMALHIENRLAQNHAHYLLPSHVQELDPDFCYEEGVSFIKNEQPLTLLHAIQADILMMRNPHEREPFSIQQNDQSIQLHCTPNQQREVEILYHNLMRVIDRENPSLCPNDIIVMAPQIADYVPYIQSIFGSKESQLDFQILDLDMQLNNEIVQGFLQLIALSDSRWDATHLLQLFGHRAFQRRHRLSQTDYYAIQEWIEKAGIRWGEDLHHRNELLERHHCQNEMVEKSDIGTWDYGLTRLLLGLTTVIRSTSYSHFETLPYDHIDFSQGDLLGQWIHLLHALRDDLMPLNDRTRMTLNDWCDYLICLLESYFQPDGRDHQSVEDYEDLKVQFEVLRSASKSFKESVFSFQSVKTHLMNLLQQRGLTYREKHIQTIWFCSMMPLRSIPAKVIALMGMQEGAFPRMSASSSLNLLVGQELGDYCPSTTDLDRYLFLEALHSAQDYLLISYQGYHYTENKEQSPSLVVGELLNYLDKFYRIQDKMFSETNIYHHPFDSFDKLYFQKNPFIHNYSFKDYQACQAYYKITKEQPHRFLQEFVLTDDPEEVQPFNNTIIDIKQLVAVVRDPIKFHLNKALEIYIEQGDERQIKNEEDLYLSPLDKYLIKQSALKEPLEEVLTRADKEGRLPLGLFKAVASKKIENEVNDLHERLAKFDLKPNDLFMIEFCTTCVEPVQLERDHWLFPAVTLNYPKGHTIQIVGKINQASHKGLVVMNKGALADVWKVWPQFLLFHHVAQHYPHQLEKQLIMIQAAKPKQAFFEDALPYLKQVVDYHQLCLNHFSPLLPDWLSLILEEDVKGLEDKMKQNFSSYFFDYPNPDLKWILHKDYLPDSKRVIQNWKKQAETLLKQIMFHWYGNKQTAKDEE